MITYEQVKKAMINPPCEELVHLYNDLGKEISLHPKCINEDNPFRKLNETGTFCISATSIQSRYIAFVLGKHINSEFPQDIISKFFNVDSDYRVQFGQIRGKNIDGCICLVHKEEEKFDLQRIYDHIYK